MTNIIRILLLLVVIETALVIAGKAKNPYPDVGKVGTPSKSRHHYHGSTGEIKGIDRVNKPGSCPTLIDTIAGTCDEGCQGDSDCHSEMKCCDNGCGHGCFLPVAENMCHIACTRELDRVCGSDGVTYSNPCILHYRTCNSNQKFVHEAYHGPCKESVVRVQEDGHKNPPEEIGPCTRELRQVWGPMKIPLIGARIPECDEDGYYLPMQCHGSTGVCICVDRNGKKLSAESMKRTPQNELNCESMR